MTKPFERRQAAHEPTVPNCAIDAIDKGDVLMVTRLDRLARSTRDLLNTLAAITGKGAGFRSLHDTWGRHHDRARAAYAGRPWRASRVRSAS
jgi:hypothetical protein